MKVLIADEFEHSGREALAAMGCGLRFEPKLKDEALVDAVRSFLPDVLVVRSTKVPEAMLAAGAAETRRARRRRLQHHRRGGGLAPRHLRLQLSRQELHRRRRAGLRAASSRWTAASPITSPTSAQASGTRRNSRKARGLFGRTLGLVGFGHIGHEDDPARPRLRHAGRRLEPQPTTERAALSASSAWRRPLEVAAAADVVSIHVALNARDARPCRPRTFFAAMRPRPYFINTARAEVVDQAALEHAVREQGIRAGLDVFAGEPAGGHRRRSPTRS